ncbi:MAG: DUF378 domain-containing protein [bacterium]|nr:DUF378 domain-containing protein [bacterium]
MNDKMIATIAGWLVVIGAVTIGIEGLANIKILDSILGVDSMLKKIADILIGIAGLWMGYKMLMGKKK